MDRFLRVAKKATEVALRLEHDATGTITTVFDLMGSARVINAMESGCESLGQPRTPQIQPPSRPGHGSSPRSPNPAGGSSGIVSQPVDALLSADDQAWVQSSCPRRMGPALWSDCVRREVEAIGSGMPDISGLATQDQAWVRSSCPRRMGPALWSDCTRREVEAIGSGMPDITGLATQDQEWVRSSCPRRMGPALWSDCVRREVEAIRGR